jgi:hypothetical protein
MSPGQQQQQHAHCRVGPFIQMIVAALPTHVKCNVRHGSMRQNHGAAGAARATERLPGRLERLGGFKPPGRSRLGGPASSATWATRRLHD